MTLTLRIATTDDELERWLTVRNVVDPRELTVAGARGEVAGAVGHRALVASIDGRDVGAGAVRWGRVGVESRTCFLETWVLPDARQQGIGNEVLMALSRYARDGGIEHCISVTLEGDADSLAFALHRGLQVEGGGQLGYFDLTAEGKRGTAASPDEFEVTSFAERPDLDRSVYDIDVLVQPEIPALAAEPTPSFEAWREETLGDPGFAAGLSLIALDGDRVLGAIQVYDDTDGTAFIGMTSVHPDARRRGVARLLKIHMAERARAGGWRRVETYNDGTNDAIRRLNEDLGYVYQPRLTRLKGPLPGN